MTLRKLLLASAALPVGMMASAGTAQTATPPAPPAPTVETTAPSAQSDTPTPPALANDIIVTARRREESSLKVPASINAFSAETLRTKQITDISQINKIAAGLNISEVGGRAAPIITLRGQSKQIAGPGTPGVLVYFNEVPLSNIATLLPTFDVGNIQVLKGPQGTLFGRNAVGGAVLTYSAAPKNEFGGYMEGAIGNHNGRRVEGALNVPVVKDVLAVRVAGQYDYQGAYAKTITFSPFTVANGVATAGTEIPGRQADQYSTKAVRASILFTPVAGVRNTTVIDWTRVRGGNNVSADQLYPDTKGFGALLFTDPSILEFFLGQNGTNTVNLFQCSTGFNCNVYKAFAEEQKHKRVEFIDDPIQDQLTVFGLSNTTTADVNDKITIKNIFGYRTVKNAGTLDGDGLPIPLVSTNGRNALRVFTDELQMSGTAGRLKYVAGAFYFNSAPNGIGGFQGTNVVAFGGLSSQAQELYLHEISKALYSQLDYDLGSIVSGLSVTGGLRYTWDESKGCAAGVNFLPFSAGAPQPGLTSYFTSEKDCDNKVTRTTLDDGSPATIDPTTVTADDYDVKFHKLTYTAAINEQLSDKTLLYITHRRGYRAGGFNSPTLVGTKVDLSSLQTFQPETLTDTEIGLKTRWRGGGFSGTFTGDVYRGNDKGFQFYQQTSTATAAGLPNNGLVLNEANLRIQGVEADSSISYAGFTLGAGIAYTEIKVKKRTVPQALIDAFNSVGAIPPTDVAPSQQPKWEVNGNIGYQLPRDVFSGQLSANFNLHYQSKYDATGGEVINGWKTVDGQVELANAGGMPIDIRLYVRNLFNAYYQEGAGGASPALGIGQSVKAPPRIFGVAVRYTFGQR